MNEEKIRTLGFYQPFGTLMELGKIETRWVRKGKTPPFPVGKYAFYSTKNSCTNSMLFEWCGPEIMLSISEATKPYLTLKRGYLLSVGDLVNVRLMTKEDEPKAFVKFIGERVVVDKHGDQHEQVQWCLEFENVIPLNPQIRFYDGKQGIGILDKSKYILNPCPAKPTVTSLK